MKKNITSNFVLFLVALFVFTACEGVASVSFKNAQPYDVSEMNDFPKKMQGTYQNQTDSSSLVIDEYTVTVIDGNYEDVIFDLQKENYILKHAMGYYFLNIPNGQGNWNVQCLGKTGKHLTLRKFEGKFDIGLLGAVTGTTIQASGETVFYPTKSEMRQFLQ